MTKNYKFTNLFYSESKFFNVNWMQNDAAYIPTKLKLKYDE